MAQSNFAQILIQAKDLTKTGFDSARNNALQFQGALGRLNNSLAGAKAAAATLLPALAGLGTVFGAAGLAAAITSTANALDAFNDAADATGASVENLSALEAIALRNGESLDTVTDAIIKLNQALAQKSDGDQAKVLSAIGLSAADLRSQDPAQALKTVADALAKFENDGNKARIVFELFGRSAAQLAPFLNDVADAGALNATVTARQAKEAEIFNKTLSALGAQITLAGRAIGTDLLPPVTAFIQRVNEARAAGASWAEQLRQGFGGGEDLAEISARIAEIDVEIEKVVKRRTTAGSIFKGGLFGLANDIDESKLINERIALVERLNRARAVSDPSVQGVAPLIAPDITGLLGAAGKTPKVPKDTSDKLRRAAQDMANEWSPLELRWNLAANDFEGGANADLAKWVSESEDRLDSLVEKYKDLADPTEKYRKELELITALEAQGKLTAEEAFNARSKVGELIDGNDKLNKTLKEQKKIGEELGLTFSSAFESAIIKGEKLSEVLRGLAQDVLQIAIRKSITEPLGGAISGVFEGIFDGIFNANGNAFGPGGLIPFAQGGVVNSPTFFKFANGGGFSSGLMGEAGPEAILPLQRGANGKLGVVASGSRASNDQPINITLQITTGVQSTVRSEIVALMPQIQQQVTAGIIDARRRGGAMARAFGG
jgi:hypothetical protein